MQSCFFNKSNTTDRYISLFLYFKARKASNKHSHTFFSFEIVVEDYIKKINNHKE
jgi:hypothetical protein